MEVILKKFTLWLFLIITAFLSAEEEIVFCQPTYIVPNQLCFGENSLFVVIDDIYVEPVSLHTDENGIYFNAVRRSKRAQERSRKRDRSGGKISPDLWQCQKEGCSYYNVDGRLTCLLCGTPRGNK